ncbi:MAG: TldD/PmbA family protein [candidate division WOR-3 bacterium]
MEKLLSEIRKRNLKFDLYFSRSEANSVTFEQSELKDLTRKAIEGVGLRVIKDGKVGFSSSNDTNDIEIIDMALNSAKYGKLAKFDFQKIEPYKCSFGSEEDRLDFEKLYPVSKEIVNYLQNKYSAKVDIDLTEIRTVINITNSNSDVIAQNLSASFSFSTGIFSITPSGFVMSYMWDWKPTALTEEDLWNVVKKLEMTLISYDKVASIKTGKYNVIFSPITLLSTLGLSVNMGVNGYYLTRGISPLKDKLNEKILSEKITIMDLPLDEFPGRREFDDEGVRTENREIISNGVLKNFLFDLDTAADMNKLTTGNGKRGSFSNMPSPAFHNFYVKEGDKPIETIIKEQKQAIFFIFPIGGGQSNLLMGDYSLNVGLGYLIENGEIVGRIKDTMISGNIYEDFQRVLEISKESQYVPSFFGGSTFFKLPHILVENVSVTTK